MKKVSLCVLCAFMVLACVPPKGGSSSGAAKASAPDADLERGLIAHFKLDGGAQDSSGKGNDGILKGTTPIKDKNGKAGGALLFDWKTMSHLEGMSDKGFPAKDAPRTFSAWIKTKEGRAEDYVIAAYGDMGHDHNSHFNLANSRIVFGFWDNEYTGVQRLTDGKWHLEAGVWDGTTVSIYVDGKLDFSSPARLKPDTTLCGSFTIGITDNKMWHLFTGAMDDVRLYDRGLSAQEIEALYRAGP